MRRFSDAYEKAHESVSNFKYSGEWQKFLTDEVGVKLVFASADGPGAANGKRLEKMRTKIAARKDGTEGDVLLEMVGINPSGTQTLTSDQAQALATLKLIRHFYLQHEQGAQNLWIYSSPFSLHKWIYEELKNTTPASAKAKLNKVDEVYPKDVRPKLGAITNQALKWCGVCQTKLGKPDTATKAKVKAWFLPGTPDDDAVDKTAKALCAGFRDVCVLLKANKLIYSDDPIDRMKGDAVSGQTNYRSNFNAYAFVAADRGEKLDVVYIQRGVLRRLGGDQEWQAILGIVHELSHRVIGTKDAVYDFKGLKPNDVLTTKHALKNADSWAYFCADMNDQLPTAYRTRYYKAPTALRQRYVDWVAAQTGS